MTSALLRTAGLPARLLLAAGAPELFRQISLLDQAEERYCLLATALADDVGQLLVPHPGLTVAERRAAVNTRRRLHGATRGDAEDHDLGTAAAAAARLGLDAILAGLTEAARQGAALAAAERQIDAVTGSEQDRLLQLPWALSATVPPLRRLLAETDPELWADVRRRVTAGERWRGKRLRQRSEYLWRLIDRGAGKATPRGWFSHVTLLPAAPDGIYPPVLGDEFVVEQLENVFERRRTGARTALSAASPAARLSLTPLHVPDGDHLVFWTADPDRSGNVNKVRLRRSPLLAKVIAVLTPGAVTLGEVRERVAPDATSPEWSVLDRFLTKLAGLGVVEVTVPLRSSRAWVNGRVPAPAASGPAAGNGGPLLTAAAAPSYADVIRASAAPVSVAACQRLDLLVRQAMRIAAAARDDRAGRPADLPSEADERSRPVLDALADRIRADDGSGHHRHHSAQWPQPIDAGSAWARLIGWIGQRADGGPVLDLTPALLDRLGLPDADPDWPCDVLLRPLTGGTAVLQTIAQAGLLDARFAHVLEELYGQVPHHAAYAAFLAELEHQTGGTFVELLVPPLGERGANAVRRPMLTRYWTGDPDLTGYCHSGKSARYLPLAAITVRRMGDRIVAEADGRVIWPVHHATRTPQPPWHHLSLLLSSANPWLERRLPQLAYPLGAFPTRAAMPRITVAGDLVICCAQWRIPAGLWEVTAPTWAKARELVRLRNRLGLPRYVYVTGTRSGPPRPCDLESLRAIPLLERCRRAGDDELLLMEALPAADHLPVRARAEPADAHAAELMLRVPSEEAPPSMAARIAGLARQSPARYRSREEVTR